MEINITVHGLDAITKHLQTGPEAVKKATARTLNEAADSGRSWAAKEITKTYNIKQDRVRDRLRVTFKAKIEALYVIISGYGRGLALAWFSARQRGFKVLRAGPKDSKERYLARGRGRPGAVTVLVKKGSGRKEVSSKFGQKPFMQVMPSGHLGVFERTGKERLPLKELYGPDIGGILQTKEISAGIVKAVLEKIKENFLRNLAFYMGRASRS